MVEYVPAKSIVNRVQNGWFGVDYNMNIYRGCSHGCIYCDSRSDCYRIDRFDQVRVKEDALRIIRDDLRRKVKKGVVATGSMSDPYNPLERDLQLTRHALELLSAYEFGAAIATKSDLILRDVDVLQEIRKISPVLCKMTVTTCDDELCRRVEPHVSVSSARFAALEKLSAGGIFTGILMMPVLPFLEDTPENVLGIIDRAAHAGVRFIYPAFGMTMRQNQREWYLSKLQELFRRMACANGTNAGTPISINASATARNRFGSCSPPAVMRRGSSTRCRTSSVLTGWDMRTTS